MRQCVTLLLVPPLRKHRPEEGPYRETKSRRMTVLTTPLLYKGTAFTLEERESLGLTSLLAPAIGTLEAQVACAYSQYQRLPDVLSKNIYLTAPHGRKEALFFRALSERPREMIPIVDVAVAVAEAAAEEGLAAVERPDIVQRVEDAMWQPQYRRIQAS
jgi:hypothetical protein